MTDGLVDGNLHRVKLNGAYAAPNPTNVGLKLDINNEHPHTLLPRIDALDIRLPSNVLYKQNLDNRIFDAQNAPEEGAFMIKRSRVQTGTDSNGKAVFTQVSGRTDAERIDNAVRAMIASGRIWDFMPDASTVAKPAKKQGHSFSEKIKEWYRRYKEPSISETYKVTLKGRIKRMCDFFRDMPVEDIVAADVQDFLNSLHELTTDTINAFKKTLADFFDDMCEDDLISKNPARSRRIKLPGKDGKGIVALEKDEIKRLYDLIPKLQDEAMRLMLALMTFAGLRREEAFGLMWEDIDFENNLLNIQRAVVLPVDAPIVKETKTGNTRMVPISDDLRAILLQSRRESGYVVLDEKGCLFTKSRYKKLWKTAKEIVGIPGLDARVLRHSYATYSASAGVEMKTLASCMGHTTMKTTFEIYTQLDSTRLGAVSNKMSDYIKN